MSRTPPDETKIVEKIEEQRGTTYVTEKGTRLKSTPSSFSVYSDDPRGEHDSIHFNRDKDGKITVTEKHGDEKPEHSDGGCYLTTACLRHFTEHFDDGCYELTTLRWFRDHFVTPDDISQYYQIAPSIVDKIDNLPDKQQNTVYEYIYHDIIMVCVQFIEQGQYDLAYDRYKSSALSLQKQFCT